MSAAFGELLATPMRSGFTIPAATRGEGVRMLNMGELFRHPRIPDVEMTRVAPPSADDERAYLAVGDLVFARRSLTLEGAGKCAIVNAIAEPTTWESSIIRARVDRDLASPEYLYYYFRSPAGRRQMETIVEQVAAAGIRVSELARLRVPTPALAEQQAIAEVLGALDDKIAANTVLAATADHFIALAFQRALDLEATSAALLDEFDVQFGEPFGGDQFCAAGIGRPLIRIRDLKTFESQIWTTEQRARETVIHPGDVVVGMDAEFRATAWEGTPGLLNQRVCKFSHETFGNALIREAIKRPLAEVEGEKSATTVIHLNKSDLARKSAAIPIGNAALQFETVAEPLYRSRIAIAQENRTLAATRDALLPQLMSGKLRVRDVGKLASAAGA